MIFSMPPSLFLVCHSKKYVF
uniref:Uncharacterized protein n=1 Tax=Arundo donax TaxID=35708 RepID=A0A0A9A3D9_ARUDO